MDFNEAWKKITDYAKGNKNLRTLDNDNVNEIRKVDGDEIVVVSYSPNNKEGKRTLRHLRKTDFKKAWDILVDKGSLTGKDLEPILRYRKYIVLAFLKWSLNLKCEKRGKEPLTIYFRE
jgi:hypothetical protein